MARLEHDRHQRPAASGDPGNDAVTLLVLTADPAVRRRLAMVWGVAPLLAPSSTGVPHVATL